LGNLEEFTTRLRTALEDERTAAAYYEELAEIAPTPEAARLIRSFAADEIRHFHLELMMLGHLGAIRVMMPSSG